VKRLILFLGALTISGCGGTNSAAPTPAPTQTTFTLSGQVTSSAGGAVSGATIRVVDGPNAGRSTSSDGNGTYSLTGLTQSGFTVNISATNYSATAIGVTLTSNQGGLWILRSVKTSPGLSSSRPTRLVA
jgi:Carboxypeptidase regulatory-like domain